MEESRAESVNISVKHDNNNNTEYNDEEDSTNKSYYESFREVYRNNSTVIRVGSVVLGLLVLGGTLVYKERDQLRKWMSKDSE